VTSQKSVSTPPSDTLRLTVADHGREERSAVAVLGVLGAKEMATRSDFVDGVECHGRLVNNQRRQKAANHGDQVGVQHHLLER